jgi:hypothetical protein
MSKAIVKRTMIVKSPHHFYELSKENYYYRIDELDLSNFIYLYENWLNGCACDDSTNETLMLQEWELIKTRLDISDFLKSTFNCTNVIFEK